MSISVLKRRYTLSHAKDQNNTSDIIGITHGVVSLGLNQKYWALQYMYIQSLACIYDICSVFTSLTKLGLQKLYSSWCFYLLLIVDYNILDADMYTLHAVTIFLLHMSTLILVLYLYYLYSIFSTSHKESPQ